MARPPSLPAIDQRKVDDATSTIRGALDPGGWGVRQDDLDRIRDTLHGLTGPEADAVLAKLDDEELKRWFDQQGDSWAKGGWSDEERRKLEVMLGEKVSLDTWRRLATFDGGRIDPPPAAGLGDDANPSKQDQAYFDSLHYQERKGDLVAGGSPKASPFGLGDVRQGAIGDCYLIAAMQSLTLHDPDAIDRLIKANSNGTYTVSFADGSQVVVSPDLPVDNDGRLAFAKNGSGPTELWPMVLEKAYATRHGGWGNIVGGNQNDVSEHTVLPALFPAAL